MKYAIACLAMAATLFVGPVQAVQLTGESTLDFSSRWKAALKVGTYSFSEVSPGQVDAQNFQNPYSVLSVTVPISGGAYDATQGVSAIQTSGGIKITALPISFVSYGGSVEITNLKIDLALKQVHATLTGDFRGVDAHTAAPSDSSVISTVENFHLFDFQTVTGATTLDADRQANFSIDGLSVTAGGYDHFVSALRLNNFGPLAWGSVSDFGTITTSVTAVPEPSTYGLALAGLAVATGLMRKRQAGR